MYLAAESEAKVPYKELLFVIHDNISMTVFIREVLVKDKTASEFICTVAATYGCKILQLYGYEANEYDYPGRLRSKVRMVPQGHQFMQHKRKKIIKSKSFCIVWTVHLPKLK